MNDRMIILAACIAGLVFSGCSDKTELHLYSWSDYISPEVVAKFEQQHDCKVIIDSFDSNEVMYSKLKAGASGYDIIFPSSYQIDLLKNEKLIEQLDHQRLQNVKKNFDRRFESQILDADMKYSVPYVVTYTGFLVLKEKVTNETMISWNVLSEKQNREKITLLDDIREVIGAGLMVNGFSINSESQAEIDQAVKTVTAWKQNVRKFDSESYRTEVAGNLTWIGHGYSSDSIQVILGEEGASMKDKLAFLYPAEGFTIAFDEMCILTSSKQKDLAHKFIDFLYDVDNTLENMNYAMGPMPHKAALEKLDDSYRQLFLPAEDVMQHGQLLKSFADKPEVQEMYNKAWDKIRSVK